ncbi:MAG: glycosyltransferase [Acidobacteria bacterium]|nr:glycosyltransferase [Acidobacteriota bacterium]
MRFSIVTPSLNQAQYLGRTIESIVEQAGDFEVEHIVRDGGSTDGSVDVLREWERRLAERPPAGNRGVRFSWRSEKDGGQSAAINAGLRCVSGDVVAYLNSDDVYCPGAFAAVAAVLQENPQADFVYGDGRVVDEREQLLWTWLSRPFDLDMLTRHHTAWNEASNYIMQPATFWRRRVMDRIGLFEESFHYSMDLEYWVRAGANGLRLEHLPVELAMFRMISGTKTTSSPNAFWPDNLEIFRRYGKAGRLAPACGYYFYNLALEHQWNLHVAAERYQGVAAKWRTLAESERATALDSAALGEGLGRVICAIDAVRRNETGLARELFGQALEKHPAVRGHALAWNYRARRALGDGGRRLAEGFLARAVARYRRLRIDYRYAQSEPR